MSSPVAPFLIRILRPDGTIAGAGFLVSERHVLTCAHVVAAALPNCSNTSEAAPVEEIRIDFPLPSPSNPLWAKVSVSGWVPVRRATGQPGGDEDIALLEIVRGTIPAQCHAANLRPVDVPRETPFESFGFPVGRDRVQLDKGVDAYGKTRSAISDHCVSIENTRDNSKGYFVEPGFSGAPLWSGQAVIGMVVRADKDHDMAYMLPARLLMKACFTALTKLSAELSDELGELLECISDRDWLGIYLSLRLTTMPAYPVNVWMAALHLMQLTDLQRGLKFIGKLGRKFEQQALIDWVARIDPHLASEILPSVASTKLLFQVEPLPTADAFQLQAWLWGDCVLERFNEPDQPTKTWDEIADEIQELVSVARSLYANLTVELALPREEFGREIAQWEMDQGETLLRQVAVVLRCQKRFAARRKQLAADKNGMSLLQLQRQERKANQGVRQVRFDDWKANSLHLHCNSEAQAGQIMFSLASNHSLDHLNQELCLHKKGVFVACGFTPQSKQASSPLCIALDYGAPLAIWFRELPEGVELDEAGLRKTLGLETGVTLGALPRHIWELQQQALVTKDCAHPHYHLTILYDDYERVPPC